METLNSWDFPDTKHIPEGYNFKEIPEATPENIVVLMNKINELIRTINTMMQE